MQPESSSYGNIAGPLPNGTVFVVTLNGVEVDVSIPFVQNTDFMRASLSFSFIEFGLGGAERVMVYREIFAAYSKGIVLKSSTNDRFTVRIQDDLSSLVVHQVEVKGGKYLEMV